MGYTPTLELAGRWWDDALASTREGIMWKRFLLLVSLTAVAALLFGGTARADPYSFNAYCNGEWVVLKSSFNGDGRTWQVSTGGSFKLISSTFYDSETGQTGTTTYDTTPNKEPNATCVYGRGPSITFTWVGVLSPGGG
jgi:hypothetical protein